MTKILQNPTNLNQSVDNARALAEHYKRNNMPKNDKYFVKVKDDKGKEYEIRYFF